MAERMNGKKLSTCKDTHNLRNNMKAINTFKDDNNTKSLVSYFKNRKERKEAYRLNKASIEPLIDSRDPMLKL
jgi:hypothetical protein